MIPTSAEIEGMDRAALLAAWSDLFDSEAPKGLSQPFLRRFLAYEVQSRRSGGVSKEMLRHLASIGRTSRRPRLKAGARLVREWNGTTQVVDVLDAGYRWNGETYRSLSAIARAITGARWSGPRFFGVRETN